MLTHDLGGGAEARMLERHHAGELYALIEENREAFGRWLLWPNTWTGEDDARGFIQRLLDRVPGGTPPALGVWLEGRMVGGLLYFPVDAFARSTELGYWLAPSAGGRGIVTRLVGAALEHLFLALELNRVALRCATENAKSRAVAERLGFTLEGVLRQDWPRAQGGGFEDYAVYGLLRQEWLERRTG